MKISHTQSIDIAKKKFLELLNKLPKNKIEKSIAQEKLDDAYSVFLLGPSSFLGISFTNPLNQKLQSLGKKVILVDDTLKKIPEGIDNCTLISTQTFKTQKEKNCLAIDMANTVFASYFFKSIARDNSIPLIDIIELLDIFDIPVIYQTAQTMREETLKRLGDYAALAEQLDDALSIQTLGACLEMRVTGKRDAVIPVLCSLEDEYFSPFTAGKDLTFSMGENEVFCDIGAHVGTTIRKFLTATQWNYSKIYAFEPDAVNYSSLKQGFFQHLHNFEVKNIALSDVQKTLTFSETGTMGSRIDTFGNVQVKASTLDNEVEHATFIKMDVEGHEARILSGAKRLIRQSKPRMAVTGYHYANDLLEISKIIKELEPRYRFRLRQHSYYYFDTIVYADIP